MKDRFWTKVDKSNGPESCWNWTAGCFWSGYGSFASEPGKQWYAHRLAFTLANGPIPDGLQCLHKCDNRKCCNPSHLFLGTNDDNMADKVRKSRQSRGEKHSQAVIPKTPRGVNHPCAKLSEDDVREIRRRYKYKVYGSTKLAAEYGVAYQVILQIVHRQIWTHI